MEASKKSFNVFKLLSTNLITAIYFIYFFSWKEKVTKSSRGCKGAWRPQVCKSLAGCWPSPQGIGAPGFVFSPFVIGNYQNKNDLLAFHGLKTPFRWCLVCAVAASPSAGKFDFDAPPTIRGSYRYCIPKNWRTGRPFEVQNLLLYLQCYGDSAWSASRWQAAV